MDKDALKASPLVRHAPHNAARGEVPIKLDGKDFILRPTYQAIAEMEASSGLSVVTLTRLIASGRIKMIDLAAVICAGLKAGGAPATIEKAGELVFKTGVTDDSMMAQVGTFLGLCLNGGRMPDDPRPGDPKTGEAEAAAER